ncbi:MarR family winged helix-turn-helix transcriptional regulator [Microbacterium paludicola]|uniref:MarR family winged helix-turn-helix transcriptional regulator n=1 Tax=Microbacterium paludicola TaxID=300019 RepID=UPI0011A99458|nr:MarR family transcriptional regulator [Microbacterium paludicola]
MSQADEVDRIVGAWNTQRPDLDFSPLEVLSRMDRLSRHLDRARRDVFRRSDIESWEWDVLSALRRAGAPFQLSPKQLLQQTLVSSGTMTNRIDRLVSRGFVHREADPGDRRSVLVTLTDDGRVRVDAAITRLVDIEAELLRALSRADRERLAALLRKLSLSFDS